MRRTFLIVAASALTLSTASTSSAQTSQRFSLQGSALFAGLFGSAFDGINNGYGGELQLRFTPGSWSFGGGIQYTLHGTEGDMAEGFKKVKLAGLFFEPRLVVPVGSSSYAPYLSGRFAFSRMAFNFADGFPPPGFSINVERPTGPTINGGGGFLINLGARTNLDIGATFGYTKFKNVIFSVSDNGTGQSERFEVEVGSGTNLVFRIGLAVGLGG